MNRRQGFVKELACAIRRTNHRSKGIVSCSNFRSTAPPRRHTHDDASTSSSRHNRNLVHEKYLTNGGIVEGVWVFHRHGDRAPNRCMSSPLHADAETEHWASRIPPDRESHSALSEHFRPEVHPGRRCVMNGVDNPNGFMDVDREPFGFLTWRGMDQMRTVGRRYAIRYERHGHRVDHGGGGGHRSATNHDWNSSSFLDNWDVEAFSTNYLRTVMSVQCFLDGLIGRGGGGNSTSNDGSNINPMTDTFVYSGGGLSRYYRDVGVMEQLAHADPSTLTTDTDHNKWTESVSVKVREKGEDTLDMFGRYPEMMDSLVRDVIAKDRFQTIDSMAAPLAERLVEYLPGLANAPQAFGGTPSGINWIHANDHFVCRGAHSVPLLAFSDHEGSPGEDKAQAELASFEGPVMSHLAWRFREWYRSPQLLAAVASPPLREVMRHMVATTGAAPTERRPFVMYSCHDVTLLGLLYALGADFLVLDDDDVPHDGSGSNGDDDVREDGAAHLCLKGGSVRDGNEARKRRETWRWWPPYSSTLVFELVRVGEGAQGVDGHIIRVILNGKSIRLVPRLSPEDGGILLGERDMKKRLHFGENMGGAESQMMRLSDFSALVNELDRTGLPSEGNDSPLTEEAKLNMSGWKG